VLKRFRPRKIHRQVSRNAAHSYGPNWEAISDYVRRRDRYRCRMADLTGGRQTCSNRFPPPLARFLVAHHIKERLRGGSDHPSNLVALCSICHSRIHGRIIGPIPSAKQIAFGKKLTCTTV